MNRKLLIRFFAIIAIGFVAQCLKKDIYTGNPKESVIRYFIAIWANFSIAIISGLGYLFTAMIYEHQKKNTRNDWRFRYY